MDTKVLFLSDGEMSLYADGRVVALPSSRMQKYMDTARELENRNAWKYEGAGAKFQEQVNPYEMHRRMAESACRVMAVVPYAGEALYALVTPDMGGLYLRPLDATDDAEQSWLSERTFHPRDLQVQGEQIVCALNSPQGESHIAVMTAGKARYEIITQGDTQDTAPFLCKDGRTLYYASAGYARNEEGLILAKGPAALLQLDLRTGELTEVFVEDSADFLRPKVGPDGALYCIRRTYELPKGMRLSLVDRAKNIGAFFKGVGKLFQFIGDPEGAKKRQPRVAGHRDDAVQKRMLEGVWLDVSREKDAGTEDDGRGCVPENWVLMRREADGSLTEVVRGVADYDFDGDALVYSDGRRIIRLADGKKTVLHKAVFIPRLAVVE